MCPVRSVTYVSGRTTINDLAGTLTTVATAIGDSFRLENSGQKPHRPEGEDGARFNVKLSKEVRQVWSRAYAQKKHS
jgi:hypothetical protein